MIDKFFVFAVTVLMSFAVGAQESPVGTWKTIDDQTGKPKSLVRIIDNGGELHGKVEKLFREPGEVQNPTCSACQDERKNQPVIGMTILTGMKKDGGEYKGGQILDPANGKVYKSRMWLTEDGLKLNVRGYIGVPMFGRTQTWVRAE